MLLDLPCNESFVSGTSAVPQFYSHLLYMYHIIGSSELAILIVTQFIECDLYPQFQCAPSSGHFLCIVQTLQTTYLHLASHGFSSLQLAIAAQTTLAAYSSAFRESSLGHQKPSAQYSTPHTYQSSAHLLNWTLQWGLLQCLASTHGVVLSPIVFYCRCWVTLFPLFQVLGFLSTWTMAMVGHFHTWANQTTGKYHLHCGFVAMIMCTWIECCSFIQ